MDTPADRLRKARIRANYGSASDFARALGLPVPTYLGHENGSRELTIEPAIRYGRALRVHPWWLLTGEAVEAPPPLDLPVSCVVSTEEEIRPFDDGPIDVFDLSALLRHQAALVIGDAMAPAYQAGDLVVFDPTDRPLLSDLLNQACIVQIAGGARMLKILARGPAPDRWDLLSHNPVPHALTGVAVEWATPVVSLIRPIQGRRRVPYR